jgi:hypothetical protein
MRPTPASPRGKSLSRPNRKRPLPRPLEIPTVMTLTARTFASLVEKHAARERVPCCLLTRRSVGSLKLYSLFADG